MSGLSKTPSPEMQSTDRVYRSQCLLHQRSNLWDKSHGSIVHVKWQFQFLHDNAEFDVGGRETPNLYSVRAGIYLHTARPLS